MSNHTGKEEQRAPFDQEDDSSTLKALTAVLVQESLSSWDSNGRCPIRKHLRDVYLKSKVTMSDCTRTLGQHIASRLLEVGVDTLFAVPGVRSADLSALHSR